MRNTIAQISNAAKQVCAAICVSRFCKHYDISHPKIDKLVSHLWAFASIKSPEEFAEWDESLNEVQLTNIHGSLDVDVAMHVPKSLQRDFSNLVKEAEGLGMCDAYGADTDGPTDMLLEVLSILSRHDVSEPDLTEFTKSLQENGWGMPVETGLLHSWQLLIDY